MVTDALTEIGRIDLVDDATLVVSELVANGVMHARTPLDLSVEPAGSGIRVAVSDGSRLLPRWTPALVTATSGRGLILVDRLSASWGADPQRQGKTVWAVIDAPSSIVDDGTEEDLLAMWSEEPWPRDRLSHETVDVTLDVEVAAMLESRTHTDDLNRELQLIVLSEGRRSATSAVLPLANRLFAATGDFHAARRQILDQTLRAAQRGDSRTTLHLRLHREDAEAGSRWLAALDEADVLTKQGVVLLPPFPAHMVAFRRDYIGKIMTKLREE